MSGEFIITTHTGLQGARLSRSGDFGNLPYPSVEAAEAAAKLLAGNRPHSIRREHFAQPVKIGAKP